MKHGVEPVLGHDVHPHAERARRLRAEPHESPGHSPAVLDVHQQVEVAVGSGLPAGAGAEDAKVADAVALCDLLPSRQPRLVSRAASITSVLMTEILTPAAWPRASVVRL